MRMSADEKKSEKREGDGSLYALTPSPLPEGEGLRQGVGAESTGGGMEPVTIVAISASPRRHGNSERMLDRAVAGAESIGARVEQLALNDFHISPCRECGGCNETGRCVIEDDYQGFYLRFISADRVILATPVFFMSVSAQAKALIDRGQALWVRKYVKKQRIPARDGFARRGYLIASAGSGLSNAFDCSRTVMKYFYKTIDMEFAGDACANGVNNREDVDTRAEDLQAAFELGLSAATSK